jgi:hypothetical protein
MSGDLLLASTNGHSSKLRTRIFHMQEKPFHCYSCVGVPGRKQCAFTSYFREPHGRQLSHSIRVEFRER